MEKVTTWIEKFDYRIVEKNEEKPWGGYYVIDEVESNRFESEFFDCFSYIIDLPKTPKFLFIAPQKRLSLQIHHRRSEKWKVIYGEVDACIDEEYIHLKTGDQVFIPTGTTHRLIGTDKWSVVAEIWIHNDIKYPSDEKDIIRLEDDFYRDSS